jgi:hypothetical protein
MAARPPDGATFEISRIGRTRSRAPLAALLWTAALVGIVAVGAFGRGSARPVVVVVEAASTFPPPTGRHPNNQPPLLGTDLALADPIDLETPAVGPVTLTEQRLTVLGKVLVHAASIEISLEARGNRVIDSIDLDVSDPDGGIRRAQQARFEVQFEVPYPRPNGTMWVVVTAYDAFGMPLGGERRPFLVGPLEEA